MSRRSQGIDVKGQVHTDTVLGGLTEYVGHQAPTWLYTHRQQQALTHSNRAKQQSDKI